MLLIAFKLVLAGQDGLHCLSSFSFEMSCLLEPLCLADEVEVLIVTLFLFFI